MHIRMYMYTSNHVRHACLEQPMVFEETSVSQSQHLHCTTNFPNCPYRFCFLFWGYVLAMQFLCAKVETKDGNDIHIDGIQQALIDQLWVGESG